AVNASATLAPHQLAISRAICLRVSFDELPAARNRWKPYRGAGAAGDCAPIVAFVAGIAIATNTCLVDGLACDAPGLGGAECSSNQVQGCADQALRGPSWPLAGRSPGLPARWRRRPMNATAMPRSCTLPVNTSKRWMLSAPSPLNLRILAPP